MCWAECPVSVAQETEIIFDDFVENNRSFLHPIGL